MPAFLLAVGSQVFHSGPSTSLGKAKTCQGFQSKWGWALNQMVVACGYKGYLILYRYIKSGIWVSNQTNFLFCLFLSVTIWATTSCVKATVQMVGWSLGEVKEVAGCPVFSDGRRIRLTSAVKVMYPKNQRILNSKEIFSGSVACKNSLLL